MFTTYGVESQKLQQVQTCRPAVEATSRSRSEAGRTEDIRWMVERLWTKFDDVERFFFREPAINRPVERCGGCREAGGVT